MEICFCLGPFRGHWFDKLRREWQMHRSFQTALSIFQPEAIFILGDLFDEGQWVNDIKFKNYVTRFRQLFHTNNETVIYGAVGNHDVGFHYKYYNWQSLKSIPKLIFFSFKNASYST